MGQRVRRFAKQALDDLGIKTYPVVGNEVVGINTGRRGRVIKEDPTDPDLRYKVEFHDGQVPGQDWLAQEQINSSADEVTDDGVPKDIVASIDFEEDPILMNR